MARLAIVGALLMVLLSIAQASTYRTIITTVIDESNPSQSERCRQQLQGMRLNSCMRYLQPNMLLPQMGQQAQDCCNELRNVSDECKCEAVEQTVENIRSYQGQGQRGQGQGQSGQQQEQPQMQEVMEKAQQLPQMCGFQCEQRQQGQH